MTIGIRDTGSKFILDEETGGIEIKTAATWVTDESDVPDPKLERVLNEYIVVRPLNMSNQLKTGRGMTFYLPESTTERAEQLLTVGRVIAVGEHAGKRPNVSSVNVGDFVLYPKMTGSKVIIQNCKVIFMYDDVVLAVIKPEDINISASETNV